MADFIGKDIGRYHIIELLGKGGMALVYKAFDTRLERNIALKIIRREAFPPEDWDRIVSRFEREAKALAKLKHPNIVNVYDFGRFDGAPYIVMELLEGGTLKDRMDHRFTPAEAAEILYPIANGLEYAHSKGILHRDVKPANILFHHDGSPVLTDFGIAKTLDSKKDQTLTQTGAGIGTPEYIAPEQAFGREIDGRADEYSLGIIFYEMLTGKKPFTGETAMAIIIQQQFGEVPDPEGVPDHVKAILLKALEKDPKNRYAAIGEFGHALRELTVPQEYFPPAPAPQPRSKPQPSKKNKTVPGRVTDDAKTLRAIPGTADGISAPGGSSSGTTGAKPPKTLLWIGLAAVLLAGIGIFAVPRLLNPQPTAAPTNTAAPVVYLPTIADEQTSEDTEPTATDTAKPLPVAADTAIPPTATATATATNTPLPSATNTAIPPTATATATATNTPLPSATNTAIPPTATATATATNTPLPSATNTAIPPTATAAATATNTPLPTATNTAIPPTATATATATNTPLPSATNTAIPPTATATATATNTPLPSATNTAIPPTATATNTPQPTATNTAMPTSASSYTRDDFIKFLKTQTKANICTFCASHRIDKKANVTNIFTLNNVQLTSSRQPLQVDNISYFEQFVVRTQVNWDPSSGGTRCGFQFSSRPTMSTVITTNGTAELNWSGGTISVPISSAGSHEFIVVSSKYGTWIYVDGEEVIGQRDTQVQLSELYYSASGSCSFSESYLYVWNTRD